MATFEIGNTEIVEQAYRQLGDDFGEIALEMLEKSAPILADEVKRNLPSEISKYSSNVYISTPKKWKNDKYGILINFSGTTPRSKDNLRNAELMAYWEYGSSKNPATGFMRKSVKNSKNEVQNKMADIAKKKLEEAFGR